MMKNNIVIPILLIGFYFLYSKEDVSNKYQINNKYKNNTYEERISYLEEKITDLEERINTNTVGIKKTRLKYIGHDGKLNDIIDMIDNDKK